MTHVYWRSYQCLACQWRPLAMTDIEAYDEVLAHMKTHRPPRVGPVDGLVATWVDRVKTIRAADAKWCNPEDAPMWRSIHEYRVAAINECIVDLKAALRKEVPEP